MDCSVVINARVDSTRLPRKLLRTFNGTTLLDIALEKISNLDVPFKFLAACEIDIIDIYRKYDSDIYLLNRSSASVQKGRLSQHITFAHYRDIPTDYIMVINPCAPFVKLETYQSALIDFGERQAKTMTSAKEHTNIFVDGNFDPINPHGKVVSSQGNKTIYEMSHLFHIFNKEFFLKEGYFWTYSRNDPYYFIVDKSESCDIDDLLDFRISECLHGIIS